MFHEHSEEIYSSNVAKKMIEDLRVHFNLFRLVTLTTCQKVLGLKEIHME
jgi:hypothetical protein